MNDFPDFMKNPANRIAATSQATPGVEGYVFDGADGSQMAFWTCRETAASIPHVHDFDEYMLVAPRDCGMVVNRSLALGLFTHSVADAPGGQKNWRVVLLPDNRRRTIACPDDSWEEYVSNAANPGLPRSGKQDRTPKQHWFSLKPGR